MSRKWHASFLLAVLAFLIAAPGHAANAQQAPEPLRIGAAISLKAALEEIAAAFEKEAGQTVALSFASSGQVMNQIQGGAPIDVFISAAQKQVDQLAQQKLIDETTRRVIATNALVLVVPTGSSNAPTGFSELADVKVRRLAIGEPKTVPAGQYAQQVLEHHKLLEGLRDRLIYGTNVRQVLSYVERGEVSAGIVYRTDALESGEKVRVVATAESDWHDPIEYPAAIVANTKNRASAQKFLEFLESPAAKVVLESRGFGVPASQKDAR